MKILIVGGTGMIGGHAAAHLQAQGNAVTLAARKPAASHRRDETPSLRSGRIDVARVEVPGAGRP